MSLLCFQIPHTAFCVLIFFSMSQTPFVGLFLFVAIFSSYTTDVETV